MKTLLVLFIAVAAASCSWIESDVGKAHYSYKFTTPDGSVHEVDIQNAKDVALVSALMEFGGVKVELLETGVNASSPMQVMADTNAKLMESLLGVVP